MAAKVPSDKRLIVAGLFAGIGGVEVGLSRAGHESNLLCEIDPGAIAVLRDKVPHRKLSEDVRELRGLPRDTQLLAAGFPCQDLSQAGKTKGIRAKRSGLVGHIFRLLERRRIAHVLIENVPFMLQGCNKLKHGGLVYLPECQNELRFLVRVDGESTRWREMASISVGGDVFLGRMRPGIALLTVMMLDAGCSWPFGTLFLEGETR